MSLVINFSDPNAVFETALTQSLVKLTPLELDQFELVDIQDSPVLRYEQQWLFKHYFDHVWPVPEFRMQSKTEV